MSRSQSGLIHSQYTPGNLGPVRYMFALLPPIRLTGAVALRDQQLTERTVALARGRIAAGPYPEVDLTGYLILPGIVDLHHSGALRQIGPNFGSGGGLAQVEQEAAAHGVTTRCVSVPWSWERPAASPEAASDLAALWDAHRNRHLVDLRLQLCVDPNMVDTAEALTSLIASHGISQVLFNDLASMLRDLRRNDPVDFARWCWSQRQRPEEVDTALDKVLRQSDRVPRHLCDLAERFDEIGVLYGSLGDRTAEAREYLSMIGAQLCVDPENGQAAVAARAVGDPVILSADSFLRPSVCGQRLDPSALVRRNGVDAFASGDHSASPLQAAFHLSDLGMLSFPDAWQLVSEAPARILRLPDRGEIAKGKRADLVIVNAATRTVEATICGGRLSFLCGEAAHRFIGLREDIHPLAAE